MNWDAIGAIGEILGAIAVVVSLLYLGTQIRAQNREARVSSVHQIVEAFRNSITAIQDHSKAEVFIRGASGFESMSESERVQYISIFQGIFRVWEEAYFHFSEGRLDEEIWTAMVAQYKDLLALDGSQRVWAIRKHCYRAICRVRRFSSAHRVPHQMTRIVEFQH